MSEHSPTFSFRLRGWNVVVLLVGFLLLVAARFVREHEITPGDKEKILLRLKADYSGPVLKTLQTVGTDRARQAAAFAQLQENQKVELTRITARGILWPKYVRVEIRVNGQIPPDNHPVRYFTLDWTGNATPDISGLKYYLNLW